MRALAGIILATSALLGGCASIPLSTAVRLSSLNPQTLAQIDPTQVRVRLSVPAGYELDIPASKLKLSLASRSYGSRSGSMALTLLQTTRDIRPGGLFGSDTTVSTYLLSLSPEGGVSFMNFNSSFCLANRSSSRLVCMLPSQKSRQPPLRLFFGQISSSRWASHSCR